MWRHQIYWVISYHLFLDTDQVLIASDVLNWLNKKQDLKEPDSCSMLPWSDKTKYVQKQRSEIIPFKVKLKYRKALKVEN